jgi:hypothetical protein
LLFLLNSTTKGGLVCHVFVKRRCGEADNRAFLLF